MGVFDVKPTAFHPFEKCLYLPTLLVVRHALLGLGCAVAISEADGKSVIAGG
jgi:hypothetical protein